MQLAGQRVVPQDSVSVAEVVSVIQVVRHHRESEESFVVFGLRFFELLSGAESVNQRVLPALPVVVKTVKTQRSAGIKPIN